VLPMGSEAVSSTWWRRRWPSSSPRRRPSSSAASTSLGGPRFKSHLEPRHRTGASGVQGQGRPQRGAGRHHCAREGVPVRGEPYSPVCPFFKGGKENLQVQRLPPCTPIKLEERPFCKPCVSSCVKGELFFLTLAHEKPQRLRRFRRGQAQTTYEANMSRFHALALRLL